MCFRNGFLVLVCCVLMLPSCVSMKKFDAAQDNITRLRQQNDSLNGMLNDVSSRLQLMEQANQAAANRLSVQDSALLKKDSALMEKQRKYVIQQQKLANLQHLIHLQQMRTDALKQKIEAALNSFNASDLSVYKKDGKVYVRMSEKLLFPSGSAVVNKSGREALGKLAAALKENPDIDIDVEGHTDTVPIHVKFKDNWALSTARANSIVRILLNTYHINAVRLTASGRSQYDPVADNSTAAGRAKNRRTEIILAPKLDKLMQLIDGSADKKNSQGEP